MACSPFSLPSSLQRPRGVGHSGAQPAGVEGGAAASPTVSAEGHGGGGRGEGDVSGLGDKPEGSTVLPLPTGDTALLGTLPAAAEMACHPVGGALPRERVGRQLQEGDAGDPHSWKAALCAPLLLFSMSNVKLPFNTLCRHRQTSGNYLSISLISLS